ncbi:MAG: FAD-binding oxidoreductase [Marinibacterium sp.]|nr:FAD-binding oxidoreductase [Marinibacterium sp.]
MKRWNSWGHEDRPETEALPDAAQTMLAEGVGPSAPLRDATLDEAVAAVPASRLPDHPLIRTDAETRLRHARGQSYPDWLALRSGVLGQYPDGVALPETEAQIEELLCFAAAHAVTVIPYGGGTSVVGHINPEAGDTPVLTIAMTRMTGLLDLDPDSQIATIGAGAPGPVVEALLKEHGYTLGHMPQSWEFSTLGGWVASRSSGQQSLRYGRIEQLFAGGRMVTPRGVLDIPALPASSAGPDLREVVLGSEGRMGILSAVRVRVTPIAEKERFQGLFFADWAAGVAAAKALVQRRLGLSMVRLSNAVETVTMLQMSGGEFIAPLEQYLETQGIGSDKVMMVAGLTGSAQQVERLTQDLTAVAKEFGGVLVPMLGDKWEHGRFAGPYLRAPLWAAGYGVDTMETAVNWSDVDATMARMETAIAGALGGDGVHVYSHLSHIYGQGCSIYSTYVFPVGADYADAMARWRRLKSAGADAIVASGGTISHQHGVGADHKPYLEAEKGALGLDALRAMTAVFDPDGLMNPGKLV